MRAAPIAIHNKNNFMAMKRISLKSHYGKVEVNEQKLKSILARSENYAKTATTRGRSDGSGRYYWVRFVFTIIAGLPEEEDDEAKRSSGAEENEPAKRLAYS